VAVVHLREHLSNFGGPLLKLRAAQARQGKRAGQKADSVPLEAVVTAIKQPNRKLQADEIDALVASYEAGESMRQLGFQYGMYVKTVRAHLVRRGVKLRQTNVKKQFRTE
jgi:hypothetical protein